MSKNLIYAPQLNVNDLEMVVVKWFKEEEDEVVQGESLCDVESTKTVLTICAEHDGTLRRYADEGDTVTVGQPIGALTTSVTEADPDRDTVESDQSSEKSRDQLVSLKARRLMEEHNLSVDDFPEDYALDYGTVVAYLKKRDQNEQLRFPPISSDWWDNANERVSSQSVLVWGDSNMCLLAQDALFDNSHLEYLGCVLTSGKDFGEEQLYFRQEDLHKLERIGLNKVYLSLENREEYDRVVNICEEFNLSRLSIVHPSAIVSRSAEIGQNSFIGAGAIIGPHCRIGDNVRVLSGARIAHHSSVSPHCRIADGVVIGGNVIIEEGVEIGLGAVINRRVHVGKNSLVVSNTTVVSHVEPDSIVRLNGDVRPGRRRNG